MGRTPAFDRDLVLQQAAVLFACDGYEATSVDDLVRKLGLHRGSLYNAFGSKRGLFLAALQRHIGTALPDASSDDLVNGSALDLLLVAAVESGHRDPEIAEIIYRALKTIDQPELLLGQRIQRRLATSLAEVAGPR